MTKSIQDILTELEKNIADKGYAIEGLELSYVDTKAKHLEVFTYSTAIYDDAFQKGFKEIGSLLFCNDTFNKGKGKVIYDSRFRKINDAVPTTQSTNQLSFKNFSTDFIDISSIAKPTYQKWITHYRKNNINGVFFFYGKRKSVDFDLVLFGVVNGSDKKQLRKDIRSLLNKFTIELNDFSMVFERLRESRKDIIQAATRAAISQVMARNMSHNIGSHVMNQLTGDIRNLPLLANFETQNNKNLYGNNYKTTVCIKEYHEKILEDTEKEPWYQAIGVEEKQKIIRNEVALSQSAIYNNYVKTRMDYLADITFGTPAMLNTKNAYRDIFVELDKVRFLLDNISGRGDKFKYEIRFVDSSGILLNEETDIPIAIPNDVLGCQAFYNIIENIIRNTAKHGNTIGNHTHVFTIKIRDILDDELTDVNEQLKLESLALYCVEIFDDIGVKSGTIEDQNNKLDTKILNEQNELRSEALGMIEMEASAAYLRQLDIVSINSDEYDVDKDERLYNKNDNFNILKAYNASKNADKTILGYRFFIKKPQLALVVTETKVEDSKKKDLAKIGVTVLNNSEFTKQQDNNVIFNQEFLIINKASKEINSNKLSSLPRRIYEREDNCISKLLENKDAIETQLWSWREEELFTDYSGLDLYSYPEIKNGKTLDSKYADHLSEMIKDTDETTLREWNTTIKPLFYFEALSSKGQQLLPDYIKLTQAENDLKKKIIKYGSALSSVGETKVKVAESMLGRIIVIDERIQEILDDTLYKIPYREHYRMSNIYVPRKKILLKDTDKRVIKDLDLKADSIDINVINEYINCVTKSENNNISFEFNPKYDFIVIHYSLLERAYKDESSRKKEETREQSIANWLGEYKDKASIVVTSGRSNIKGLPDHVSFVNLSAVTTALKEIKSKYLIHQILYSSRKLKK